MPNSSSDNIFIKDIDIKGGYQTEDYTDASVALYTTNQLTYSLDNDDNDYNRVLKINWVKDFDGKFILIDNEGKLGKNEITWLIRTNEEKDESGEPVWVEIEQAKNIFEHQVKLSTNFYKYEYKIIIKNIETEEELESNIITFNRSLELNDSLDVKLINADTDEDTGLKIVCPLGDDTYNFYWKVQVLNNKKYETIEASNLEIIPLGESILSKY
jgi:hypothetical protein